GSLKALMAATPLLRRVRIDTAGGHQFIELVPGPVPMPRVLTRFQIDANHGMCRWVRRTTAIDWRPLFFNTWFLQHTLFDHPVLIFISAYEMQPERVEMPFGELTDISPRF
ncbi:MAG: hypothetical protein VXZ53_21020, partial [Planctomycetota bacterium]|nr:hypothetical protein [Planctomycetota bacterium]